METHDVSNIHLCDQILLGLGDVTGVNFMRIMIVTQQKL